MNAIVATPDLRGWGFPVGANVTRMLRRPRKHVEACSAAEADFIRWAADLHYMPKPFDIMDRFRVSRATAYRWLDNLAAAQRRAA